MLIPDYLLLFRIIRQEIFAEKPGGNDLVEGEVGKGNEIKFTL